MKEDDILMLLCFFLGIGIGIAWEKLSFINLLLKESKELIDKIKKQLGN